MDAPKTTSWLTSITHDSARTIAANIGDGISHSTITRAAASDTPPAHIVIAIARAYRVPVVPALYHAGIITEEEAHPYRATSHLRTVPSLILLEELRQREINRDN